MTQDKIEYSCKGFNGMTSIVSLVNKTPCTLVLVSMDFCTDTASSEAFRECLGNLSVKVNSSINRIRGWEKSQGKNIYFRYELY